MKSKAFRFMVIVMVVSLLLPTMAVAQEQDAPALDAKGAPQAQPAGGEAAAGTRAATAELHKVGEPAVYIIQLVDPPVASYQGGIAGLEATNPAARGEVRLDAQSEASVAYAAYLVDAQASFQAAAEAALGRSLGVKFTYQHAFNGLAVELTPAEAGIVAELDGVRQVQREFVRYPQTDVSPEWLGAPGIWEGTATGGLPGTQGEGVVIGVIDTGQNLDHPSFAEVGPIDGYLHDNPLGSGTYLGLCDSDPGTWVCNDKFVGYYIFTGETTEDTDGHGTHTASTAAGNHVTATLDITDTNPYLYEPRISGVAPHANLVGYDACSDTGGCPGAALVAAINQAVADGVDVINYSIGGGSSNPWTDSDSLAFLAAAEAGVVPVTSAGNNGPGAGTVGSPADAPWMVAVGATTHNRAASTSLIDMTGGDTTPPADLLGQSLSSAYGPASIVLAGDYGDQQCLTPFPAGTWTNGEIVICDRGTIARVAKGANVLAGGAGGLVLANTDADGESIVADPHVLPAVHIGDAAGDLLRAWVDTGTGHMATIEGTTLDYSASNGDIMAGFSSRGPNINTAPDIVKPDIAAPGVSVLAAFRSGSGPAGDAEPWMDEYNFMSGTSMASPHGAGSAALLVALHPDWTPQEVKSALMGTAWTDTVLKEDGATAADPFDIGGGRVDLSLAGQVGLVMDETGANFRDADPALGGEPKTLNLASMADSACLGTCSWERVVTSPLDKTSYWTASVSAPAGMTLTVTPTEFTLMPGASQMLTVTAEVGGLPLGDWVFGEVMLEGEIDSYQVYLPLVVNGSGGGEGSASRPAAPSAVSQFSVPGLHLPVAVVPSSEPPIIVVDPESLSSSQAAGITTTHPLTIGNIGGMDLEWEILEDDGGTPVILVDWMDDFDAYATGSQMHGQGGWKGWANDPAAGALTTDLFARSTPNSVEIVGASDLVHEYSGYTTGWWIYTAHIYIPGSFAGESYFIMLNTYDDAGATNNWSTQVKFDSVLGQVVNEGVSGGALPLITDQWVELRVEINLVNDTQEFYYDDQLLFAGTWTDEQSGAGALNIGAVDLFANSASPVYYDDMSLVETVSGICDSFSEIPWVVPTPITGTTAPGAASDVDVVFDSAHLSAGSYSGHLCVASNDPETAIVAIPVDLTVTGGAPTMLLDEGFEGNVMPPAGGWTVTNTHSTRNWTIVDNPSYVHSGTYAGWVNYDTPEASDEWLVSPVMDLTSLGRTVLDFWALSDTVWCPSGGAGATMKLHVTDASGSPMDLLWDMCEDEDWPSFEYRLLRVDLSAYAGQQIGLAWQYVGIDGESFGLDDIYVSGIAP